MIRDAVGTEHRFPAAPRRIVSLVPSLTETLFDLGLGAAVAGVSDYCIFPPDALERAAAVGGTKNPDVEAIRALAPDLVHMNLEENLARHAEAIRQFAAVFVSEPKTVRDVRALLITLGEIHERGEAAAAFAEQLDRAVTELPRRSFTFACPIWKDPWMWCGGDTYVSDLVTTAGGRNVLGEQKRYPRASPAEVMALSPDVVFMPDEPYAFASSDAEPFAGAQVIGPFPGHLFTWHGTRTIKGLRFLGEALDSTDLASSRGRPA